MSRLLADWSTQVQLSPPFRHISRGALKRAQTSKQIESLIQRRQQRVERRAAASRVSSFKILVAEAQEIPRVQYTELLRSVGFNVMAAEDAESAQALMVHHHIDLVVMGADLGGTSGSEMIARIKELRCVPQEHSIPAILVVEPDDIEAHGAFRSRADLVCLKQMVASMLIPQVLFLLP